MSRLEKINIFKLGTHKIKTFFQQHRWREVFTFMFFLLLSLAFWSLRTLQDEYEIEIILPVKYKNIPADKVLTGNNPQRIVAKIKDRGTVLINYSWFRTFAPLEINVAALQKSKNKHITVDRKTIEANISKQLISSTSLLNFEPSLIQVEYNDLLSKKLSVIPDVRVTTEEGFQVSDDITVTPEKVQVYAGRTVLDSLSAVKTVTLKVEKMNKTKEFTVRLQKIDGVRYVPEKVKVKIPVEEYTEKRLTLAVQCDSIPDNYVLRMFPATVEILCNIPLSRFKDLSETDFEIHIPFHDFEANREVGKVPVRLTKHPHWLSNPVLNPQVIEFILEQK